MINRLTGQVREKREKYAVVETAGLGYRLFLLSAALNQLTIGTSPVTFYTHLAVREDALDLYGFLRPNELDCFELLISVSGIGPRGAQAILGLARPEDSLPAIAAGDANYLTKVSGIGRKRAEKIVLELREKVGNLPGGVDDMRQASGDTEAIEALQALGYSATEARDALRLVPVEVMEMKERLRAALRRLGRPN